MRTLERVRASSSNVGYRRVGSLILLGALVLMLSSYTADQRNWSWLTGDNSDAESIEDESRTVAVAPASSEKVLSGPTDEDAEQWETAQEELLAISDGTLAMQKEEMPSYWRMFFWAQNQSAQQMLKRAKTDITLDDMMQRSTDQRGKLIKLPLNLKRVLSYDAPNNQLEIKTVYEMWGWSQQTQSWLYVGLTSELPAGMPIGDKIDERVTFVGYFLKIQGYQAAQSKPNEKPLSAPLLIGRIVWHPKPKVATTKEEPWWSWAMIGAAGVLVVCVCVWPIISKRGKHSSSGRPKPPVLAPELNDFQADDAQANVPPYPGTANHSGNGESVESN